MSGERRFRLSIRGFNKEDVNKYIESVIDDFERKLKEKDDEISALREENSQLRMKYEELLKKEQQINEERARVADVLIKAEEKAQMIIKEAEERANEERLKIEEIIEKEKEKLVDIKEEIRALRKGITFTLKKYNEQLEDILGEQEEA